MFGDAELLGSLQRLQRTQKSTAMPTSTATPRRRYSGRGDDEDMAAEIAGEQQLEGDAGGDVVDTQRAEGDKRAAIRCHGGDSLGPDVVLVGVVIQPEDVPG